MANKHKKINKWYLKLSLLLIKLLRLTFAKKTTSYKQSERVLITDSYCKIIDNPHFSIATQPANNVVYTYILDNYDDLKDPKITSDGWQYRCFSDGNITSDIWQMKSIPKSIRHLSNKQIASMLKIQHHKLFDDSAQFIVSMDGSMLLNVDLNDFLNQHWDDDYDLMIVKHPLRSCVYDEAVKVIEYKFDYPFRVIQHIFRYMSAGYPENYGLNSSGFMIKNNHSEKLKRVCDIWASEYLKGSDRDQLSLNYAMWQAGKENIYLKVKEIDFNWLYKESDAIQIKEHKL